MKRKYKKEEQRKKWKDIHSSWYYYTIKKEFQKYECALYRIKHNDPFLVELVKWFKKKYGNIDMLLSRTAKRMKEEEKWKAKLESHNKYEKRLIEGRKRYKREKKRREELKKYGGLTYEEYQENKKKEIVKKIRLEAFERHLSRLEMPYYKSKKKYDSEDWTKHPYHNWPALRWPYYSNIAEHEDQGDVDYYRGLELMSPENERNEYFHYVWDGKRQIGVEYKMLMKEWREKKKILRKEKKRERVIEERKRKKESHIKKRE